MKKTKNAFTETEIAVNDIKRLLECIDIKLSALCNNNTELKESSRNTPPGFSDSKESRAAMLDVCHRFEEIKAEIVRDHYKQYDTLRSKLNS